MNLDNIKFSRDHEWASAEGTTAHIGISDFAQKTLGDIVFVELPLPGQRISAGAVFSEVESVKAVSDIIAPVSGEILEVNDALNDAPELLNENPYENWIVKVRLLDPSELDALMDAKEYEAYCRKGE
jgi:glycine cleavage system H protein